MTDDASPQGVTLEEMARAVARMTGEQERLRAENEELAARLRRLEGPPPATPPPSLPTARPEGDGTGPGPVAEGGAVISRRGAFKTIGAAAAFAGAGAVVGSTLLGADPAAAAVEYVKLGETSDATATTNVATTTGYGLSGTTSDATAAAVLGDDTSTAGGVGVKGQSTNGIGVTATGGLTQLYLVPSRTDGPPTTGIHTIGEQYLDEFGLLYGCVTGGNPGTWQRMIPAAPDYNNAVPGSIGLSGSVNLLSAPIRVFDSRLADSPADPSRPASPLTSTEADVALTIVATLVGGVGVPHGAVGVIGNVTAVNPAGLGTLVLYPEGATLPVVSNLNYQNATIANYCIVALNSDNGQVAVHVLGASTDVLFDVTGFVFGAVPLAV